MCNYAAQEAIIAPGSALKIFNVLRPLVRSAWGRFSKQPQWRAFVSGESYYQAYLRTDAAHALIQHTGPLVGDTAQQIELINGMAGGRAAAIVWAPPGCGKSRFALELARRMEKAPPRWQVLFVQHDDNAIREELHELTRLKGLVFIVDDAHDCPDLVKMLAAACAASPSTASLHLVCLTRSTGRAAVSRALQGAFAPGTIQEMDLGRPSTGLVRNLIDRLLPKSSPHHRDTIARFVRQSYFGAVLVCTLLSRQRTLPQTFQRQDLRDRVCREPLKDVAEGVCPIEAALRALGVYAGLSPVSRASPDARELAAQLSGLAPATIDVLIDRLLAAELFQEYGPGLIRPIPDLLGDLILEEACLDAQGRPTPYSKQLLERLFETDPVATVRNCTDIGQLFGTAEDSDLVSGLVVTRARTVSSESKWEVMKLLQTCRALAAQRPSTILEVASILETRGILRRNPPAHELFGIDSIEMDTFALLMRAAEADPNVVPVALQLGRDLSAAARGDDRSSQHVLETLQPYCRFNMGRGSAHAKAVANTLRTWVSESDVASAALAVYLSGQFLTLDVEGKQDDERSLELSSSGLNPVPDVWEVRDVAADTIARAISRAEPTIQYAALGALQRFGDSQHTPDPAWPERWHPQLARELDKISEAIIQLTKKTACLPVCAAAERLGWHWWTQESALLRRGGAAVLTSTPSTDAYQLWKLLHSQQLPTITAPPPDEQVAADSRLEYFQSLSALREEDTVEQARRLFDALDPRYSNTDSWRVLWHAALGQTPVLPLHYNAGAAIREFAHRHAEVAWSLVNETEAEGPLFPMLTFLLVELGKQDHMRRSEMTRHVRPGTRLEEAWLRALWAAQAPEAGERALIARGLQSPDLETVHRAAAALLNTSRANPREAFEAVFVAIARHPADGTLWDLLIQHFVDWAHGVLPPGSVDPTEAMAWVADSLITLMQRYGSNLRWGFQPYTRQLTEALAILAVVCPERLQEWMQRAWGHAQHGGSGWNDESPLSVNRLAGVMRAIRDLPVAARWIDVFVKWMRNQRPLGNVGALGLAELCTLDHPSVAQLVNEIAPHPTEASLQAVAELIRHQSSKADFPQQSLALLEAWARYPDSYAQIESVIMGGLVHVSGGRSLGQPWPAHLRALEAIAARRAAGTNSALLSASLVRAEREVREAMSESGAGPRVLET